VRISATSSPWHPTMGLRSSVLLMEALGQIDVAHDSLATGAEQLVVGTPRRRQEHALMRAFVEVLRPVKRSSRIR